MLALANLDSVRPARTKCKNTCTTISVIQDMQTLKCSFHYHYYYFQKFIMSIKVTNWSELVCMRPGLPLNSSLKEYLMMKNTETKHYCCTKSNVIKLIPKCKWAYLDISRTQVRSQYVGASNKRFSNCYIIQFYIFSNISFKQELTQIFMVDEL